MLIISEECNPGIRVRRAGRGRNVRKETRTFWEKSDKRPKGRGRFYLIRKKNLKQKYQGS